MKRSDLIGIFYNDDYLLKITNRYVQLNTNIKTDHKPFYTNVLWREKFEYQEKGEIVEISENLSIMFSTNFNTEITLKLELDETAYIPLKRFK
ncbi:hypothetical protein [Chryseobacterium luquanense]|uniref:Uncharacterized protein n=1 Tax=Chryseobacterium luquanense TaxID=2983766 RepID=A0ABT3Y8Y8_9FLAO|nr:hypothetical protein [Chryseobacterium luquanense]MCX8534645.1 hypothetical protein [Chryseobacterium luquanense]